MKLCKSCAESLHEQLQQPGDPGLHIAQIADVIRDTLHPPAPEPKAKKAKKAKGEASAAVEGAEA